MAMEHAASRAAFDQARQYIPGGVNSPVRAFRAVGTDRYSSAKPRAPACLTWTATNISTTSAAGAP